MEGQPILKPENIEKVDENPEIIALLEFMLVRDPQHRPSLKATRQKFKLLFGEMLSKYPRMDTQTQRH